MFSHGCWAIPATGIGAGGLEPQEVGYVGPDSDSSLPAETAR